MKRLIVVLLSVLLLSNQASAEYFPAGCYVADYYRTDPCWGEDINYFTWPNFVFGDPDGENEYYGSAVATMLNQETTYRLNYIKVAQENTKNKKLIKKLKSKCGSACRNIR